MSEIIIKKNTLSEEELNYFTNSWEPKYAQFRQCMIEGRYGPMSRIYGSDVNKPLDRKKFHTFLQRMSNYLCIENQESYFPSCAEYILVDPQSKPDLFCLSNSEYTADMDYTSLTFISGIKPLKCRYNNQEIVSEPGMTVYTKNKIEDFDPVQFYRFHLLAIGYSKDESDYFIWR